MAVVSRRFNAGQIIELDATGFLPGAALQTGDRGTILSQGILNEFGHMEHKILWHKNGWETHMIADRLRLYVNSMDLPGRAKGAFETMDALRVVLQEEQPHAMDEVLRELERARMTAEDSRSAMVSPYPTNTGRDVSWREFGMERNDMCDHMTFNRIDPAMETLARARFRVAVIRNGPVTNIHDKLTDAYNDLCDAEWLLRDESNRYDEEMESEDEEIQPENLEEIQPDQEMEPDVIRMMLEEFMDTGAHHDETLREQFPLFRGTPPPGHPYPEAWSDGAPQE